MADCIVMLNNLSDVTEPHSAQFPGRHPRRLQAGLINGFRAKCNKEQMMCAVKKLCWPWSLNGVHHKASGCAGIGACDVPFGYSILGYDDPNPVANQQIRHPATQNFDELGEAPHARIVRSRRGPNNPALVSMLSFTLRGRSARPEMRFPQCQHQGG